MPYNFMLSSLAHMIAFDYILKVSRSWICRELLRRRILFSNILIYIRRKKYSRCLYVMINLGRNRSGLTIGQVVYCALGIKAHSALKDQLCRWDCSSMQVVARFWISLWELCAASKVRIFYGGCIIIFSRHVKISLGISYLFSCIVLYVQIK